MECKNDLVNYEGKEYRALKIIKKLNLSRGLYYNKREIGMYPQEAFLYCLSSKKKREQIGTLNPTKISQENNIAADAIYRGLYNDKPIDKIILEQKAKQIKRNENLEYLYKIGLPSEYSSLTKFCVDERINENLIRYYIQNGMNLYDAVANSLTVISIGNKACKYCFCGLQLSAIALKYGCEINQLRYLLRKGFNYIEAIEREVFARTFSEKLGGRFNYLWNIYQNEFLKGLDVQDKVTKSEFANFVIAYSKMEHIKRYLNYYHFLEFIDIEKFKLLSLDERVKNVLLTSNDITFSLSELYYILDFENGLMKDFEFIKKYGMWVYLGNSEVLKKLKKPSD